MKLRLRSLSLVLAAVAVAASSASARIYPAWSPNGTYQIALDPGFLSLAGTYSFPLGGEQTSASIHYAEDGAISAAGLANFTLFALEGAYSVDADTHEQHVHLADPAKVPLFTFDGVVSPDGADIVGTFTRKSGFVDLPGDESGPLTFHRTGAAAQSRFTLSMALRMDDRGKVRGRLAPDGRTDTTAELTLYDGRVVSGGRISGKVKTDRNALTRGVVRIRGKGWKAALAGPIDADGFAALVGVDAAGFQVDGMAALLAVQPGPEPPDGSTPKPPANLLEGGQAVIANGQMTVTHPGVPSKFFGKAAGISVEFPTSDGVSTRPADVSTDGGANPRRVIVTLGGTAYTTKTAPVGNGVSLKIQKFSSVRDGLVEVLLLGRVFSASGKVKDVNMLLRAAVQ